MVTPRVEHFDCCFYTWINIHICDVILCFATSQYRNIEYAIKYLRLFRISIGMG